MKYKLKYFTNQDLRDKRNTIFSQTSPFQDSLNFANKYKKSKINKQQKLKPIRKRKKRLSLNLDFHPQYKQSQISQIALKSPMLGSFLKTEVNPNYTMKYIQKMNLDIDNISKPKLSQSVQQEKLYDSQENINESRYGRNVKSKVKIKEPKLFFEIENPALYRYPHSLKRNPIKKSPFKKYQRQYSINHSIGKIKKQTKKQAKHLAIYLQQSVKPRKLYKLKAVLDKQWQKILNSYQPEKYLKTEKLKKLPSIIPHKLKEYYMRKYLENPPVHLVFTSSKRRKMIMNNYEQQINNQIIGEEAFYQYYDTFKHMEIFNRKKDSRRIIDADKNTPVKHMINTSINKETGVKLLPRKLDIVKFTGQKDIINLKIGDRYAAVLQKALKNMHAVQKLQISNNRLTYKGIETLFQNKSILPNILDLSKNQMGIEGVKIISEALQSSRTKIQSINLEGNQFGSLGIVYLCNALKDNQKLHILNISNNEINDDDIWIEEEQKEETQKLSARDLTYRSRAQTETIQENQEEQPLEPIEIPKIRVNACESIQEMFTENSDLREIYMKWNKIKANGAMAIFDGLICNGKQGGQIAVFDISWNLLNEVDFDKKCEEKIGIGKEYDITAPEQEPNTLRNKETVSTKIAEVVLNLSNLVHFDISNNKLNRDDAFIISQALEQNHTLYGFHNEGNYGNTDEKMFLVEPELPVKQVDPNEQDAMSDDSDQEEKVDLFQEKLKKIEKHELQNREFGQQIYKRQINGVKCLRQKQVSQFDNHVLEANCWICEGWSHSTFEFVQGVSGLIKGYDPKTNPIFIHFGHEKYKPRLLNLTKRPTEEEINKFQTKLSDAKYMRSQSKTKNATRSYMDEDERKLWKKEQQEENKLQADWESHKENTQKVLSQINKYSGTRFSIDRMCPPGKVNFFYSTPRTLFFDESYDVTSTKIERNTKYHYVEPVTILYGRRYKTIRPQKIHQRINKMNKQVIDKFYLPTPKLQPRIPDEVWIPPNQVKIRAPWALQYSVFKFYPMDDPNLMKKCLKLDFSCSKIEGFKWMTPKLLIQLKRELQENYELLRNVYKYYSTLDMSDVNSMSFLRFQEFYKHSQIEDKAELQASELDLVFTSATATQKRKAKFNLNPLNAMIRYEFIEAIVRIAYKKYKDIEINEAVKRLIDQHIRTYTIDLSGKVKDFRDQKYWNEECDSVIKIYADALQYAFLNNLDIPSPQDRYKFMSREKFINFCDESGLINDLCGISYAVSAFGQSQPTVWNSLEDNSMLKMEIMSFMEVQPCTYYNIVKDQDCKDSKYY